MVVDWKRPITHCRCRSTRHQWSSMLLFTMAVLTIVTVQAQQQQQNGGDSCTVCVTGDPITLPDEHLGLLEPVPMVDCAAMDSLAVFLTVGSSDCDGVQSIGSLCGCPKRENACTLCGNDGQITRGNHTLQPIPADLPRGLRYDCDVLEAQLNVLTQDNDVCLARQTDQRLLRECGCSNYQEPTQQEQEQQQLQREPCTLCPFGLEANFSNARVDDLFGTECSVLGGAVAEYDLGSNECQRVQNLSSLCGCPVSRDACQMCPHGMVAPEQPHGNYFTCEFVAASLHTFQSNDTQCLAAQQDRTVTLNSTQYTEGITTAVEIALLQQEHKNKCLCKPPPETCSLCPNGEWVPLPDKAVDTELLRLPSALSSCAILAGAAAANAPGTDECLQLQVFGKYCGCSPIDYGCSLCPNEEEDGGDAMKWPTKVFQWTRGHVLDALPSWLRNVAHDGPQSCEILDSNLNLLYQEDSTECFVQQLRSDACGCKNQNMLIYMICQRIASGLSILVSHSCLSVCVCVCVDSH